MPERAKSAVVELDLCGRCNRPDLDGSGSGLRFYTFPRLLGYSDVPLDEPVPLDDPVAPGAGGVRAGAGACGVRAGAGAVELAIAAAFHSGIAFSSSAV